MSNRKAPVVTDVFDAYETKTQPAPSGGKGTRPQALGSLGGTRATTGKPGRPRVEDKEQVSWCLGKNALEIIDSVWTDDRREKRTLKQGDTASRIILEWAHLTGRIK